MQGLVELPDRVIVRTGDDASTASLLLGFMSPPPGVGVAIEPAPVARSLAAHGAVTGTKTVPLPLAAWHPYISMMPPLTGAPTQLVLDVSYLPAAPRAGIPAWADQPSSTGTTLHLPNPQFIGTALKTLRGPVIPIP